MSFEKGDIVEGKITGITNFGAFVALPEGKNGLIHISEVSRDYVEQVSDYLKVDQEVKVKVISIENNKISLSIKQLEAEKPREKKAFSKPKRDFKENRSREPRDPMQKPIEVSFDEPKQDLSFEDMMSKYLKDSNDKIDDIRSRDGKRGAGQRLKSRNPNF